MVDGSPIAGVGDDFILPVLAIVITVGGPILWGIVVTLTKHQRLMAEAMKQTTPQNEKIAQDISELKKALPKATILSGAQP